MAAVGSARFRDLAEALRNEEPRACAQGLRGSSRAYLLGRLVRELARPALVLTATLSEARRFGAELSFFLGAPPNAGPGAPVVIYPAWETAPFEPLPPLPEVSARRVSALERVRAGGACACVAPVAAVLQRTVPTDLLGRHSRLLRPGDEIERDALVEHLVRGGYHRVGQVEERGEVSVRGGIVDLFPPSSATPVRIELFGDEVDSIRPFDPESQRSAGRLDEVLLLPAREVVVDDVALVRADRRIRTRGRELSLPRSKVAEVLEALRSSHLSPLRELLFPYFYETAPPLWAHFGADPLLVFEDSAAVEERATDFYGELQVAHGRARERDELVPAVDEVYLTREEWASRFSAGTRLDLEPLVVDGRPGRVFDFSTQSNQDLSTTLRQQRGRERLFEPLAETIRGARDKGHGVWLAARSPGGAKKIQDILGSYEILVGEPAAFPEVPAPDGAVHLAVGPIARGFRFPEKGLVLITEAEIFGEKVRASPLRRGRRLRTSLGDLDPGDPVVHADFGVGLYRGLVHLEVAGEEGDFLHLEYAGEDRLYLPVTRIGLVQKYVAPGDGQARLDKLGGSAWSKARARAREGIEKMAHDLLELYARRQQVTRPPFSPPDVIYREFEATFPYEETPDQQSAIGDVLADMGGAQPMDRLICGDVGYGKTEVAIRAAMLAVLDGRQVAVLVPTTVLAAQHFQSFRKRFEGYPIRVEMLSRFVTAGDQRQVAEQLATGRVDVVIGTHRLLQKDVRFRNLGLVVIDEEHRFGVRQKERLKELRSEVDVLTLSATPIPRTLNMGLAGVRDLSVIETPPQDRLAVRTSLARFDEELIREAVQRELNRGGQVYFVHNRVQSIGEMADLVRGLFPRAGVAVGHGQMRERELERVMEAFVEGSTDILVCTAIIESGLDIPRANTIIINRADRFGLADLYQLRGRVGRSNLRAYAYLLVDGETDLSAEAHKRLQALQEFTELGAGFKIATHDLEIRGAGELLGKEQSGHIAAIGFDLYVELLEEAVGRLRGAPSERAPEPDIHLKVVAHFPADYVPEPKQRLVLYERLTRIRSAEEADELGYELIDRYGPLPREVLNLIEVMKIRRRLVELRALGLDYTGKDLVVSCGAESRVDPERVLALLQADPGAFRVTPDHRVLWTTGPLSEHELFARAGELLNRLG